MKKITLFLLAFAGSTSLFAQAAKKVIVEDMTGTWCGYCPRGTTVMADILNTYPNAIGIGDHVSDTYQNSYTSAVDNDMNNYGYPGGMVDRFFYTGQSEVVMSTSYWKSKTASRLLTTTPVAVYISSTYNSSTRQLNATVYANFVGSASGDMRISCVLIEDSVVGSQTNYMGNGCSDPDPSSPWYSYPCNITNFIHLDVCRGNLAPTWGTAGVIPSSVTSGQNFSQSYSYTIPASYNASSMSIVGFVSYYATSNTARSILNSSVVRIGASNYTSIEEHPELNPIEVKQNTPNPFKNITAIPFTLNTTDNVTIKVYNMMGQEVNTLWDSKLIPGEHTFYWAGDDNDGNPVAAGVYYCTISTSSYKVAKPMIFAGE